MNTSILDYERVHVNGVSIPDLKNKTNPYFRLELSYELPLKVPFIGKSLRIQASAAERLWIGDTGEGSDGSGDGTDSTGSVTVLSKPEPAYIGNNAMIRVKVEPGTTANLTIFYKSGRVQPSTLVGQLQMRTEKFSGNGLLAHVQRKGRGRLL
ncbi:hypothetical protein [Paenibacillus sp. DCT19]|uniref:hypothetical protein n=1 Tax=Paenibacillus sp. DCT19 TaxID=2211212 RepID=UPI0034A07970